MPFASRLLTSLLFVCASASVPAQQVPQLLVVGAAHLGNPDQDMNNIHVDDVLAPQRQREMKDLVDHLARFKPTRVAIECAPAQQGKFDTRYQEYRAGTYTLTADERDQVGLRLAAQLNLPRVDCVDYTGGAPGPQEAYDFPGFAAAHGRARRWTTSAR